MQLEEIETSVIGAYHEFDSNSEDSELLLGFFVQKRYSEVIEFCSQSTLEWTSLMRVIHLQSLMHTQMYDDCMRELAVLIVAEYNSYLRYHLSLLLVAILARLEKKDYAAICLKDITFDIDAELQVREGSDPHCVKLKSLRELCDSIDVKATKLVIIDSPPYKCRLSVKQKCVLDACSVFLRRGIHKAKRLEVEHSLNVIFSAVTSLELSETFDSILKQVDSIVQAINREFRAVFHQDVESFKVQEWSECDMDDLTRFDQASIIVKSCLTMSFFHRLDQRFEESIAILRKAIGVLDRLKAFHLENDTINIASRNTALLLIIQCHTIGKVPLSSEDALDLLFDFAERNINPLTEFVHGRLSEYCLGCALLYEQLGNEQDLPIENRRRLVLDMIRKLVLAVTTSTSAPLEIYEWILWGILIHGEFHKRVFWFFYVVRSIEASKRVHKCQRQYERLSLYTNGWELAQQIYLEYQGHHEKEWIIDPKFILPSYKVQDDTIVECNTKYSEVFDPVAVSVELIDTWKGTYSNYRGAIPAELHIA